MLGVPSGVTWRERVLPTLRVLRKVEMRTRALPTSKWSVGVYSTSQISGPEATTARLLEGVPVLLPSRFGQLFGLVGGVGFEHGQEDVAASAGDAEDRGVMFLALVSFALVIGAGVWVVSGSYERGDEHGVLQAVVTAS